MRQLFSTFGKLFRFHDAVTRLPGDEARVLEQRPMETEQRRDAADLVLVKRTQHPPPGVLAVDAVNDELGDQRVVQADDLAARPNPRVDPDARTPRLAVARDPPWTGQKAVRRVLGVDPALDRVSGQPNVVLAQR